MRERTLLRLHTVEGLSLERMGVMYRKDKATLSRWLAAAREKLAEETRARLAERLALAPPELASLLRAIRSQLEVSLLRLLPPEEK